MTTQRANIALDDSMSSVIGFVAARRHGTSCALEDDRCSEADPNLVCVVDTCECQPGFVYHDTAVLCTRGKTTIQHAFHYSSELSQLSCAFPLHVNACQTSNSRTYVHYYFF